MAPIRKGDGTGLGAEGYSQVRKGDGTVLWNAIPDSEVYLHDDWADNLLSGRVDSDTTTHNDVEGVYRPEWTIDKGSPSVSDGVVSLDSDKTQLITPININLDFETKWWWRINDGGGRNSFGLFSETDTDYDDVYTDSWQSILDSYQIQNSVTDNFCRIIKQKDDNTSGGDTVVNADTSEISSGYVGATRSPGGDWELFVSSDGSINPDDELFTSSNSVGTGTDTEFTSPNYIWFGNTESSGTTITEVKVK